MEHFKEILTTEVSWCDSKSFSPASQLLLIIDALHKSGTHAFLVKSRTMTIFFCLACWWEKYEEPQKPVWSGSVRIPLWFKKIKDYSAKNGHKIRKGRKGWSPKPDSVFIRQHVLCTEEFKVQCIHVKQCQDFLEEIMLIQILN